MINNYIWYLTMRLNNNTKFPQSILRKESKFLIRISNINDFPSRGKAGCKLIQDLLYQNILTTW